MEWPDCRYQGMEARPKSENEKYSSDGGQVVAHTTPAHLFIHEAEIWNSLKVSTSRCGLSSIVNPLIASKRA